MSVLHSDHLNYLILRYLEEHGHENAATAFHKDWQRPYHYRDPEALPFARVVPRDALVSVVQDGLFFDELSATHRKTHRRHRWTAVNPRAPLDEQDLTELDDGADTSRPPSSGKRKSRPPVMRAPDEFPTPAPKRQRRNEGAEGVHVNGDGDAMDVDETSPTAATEDDAEVASPAGPSEAEAVEVPERYDSMDVMIQTDIKDGPKTSTMYWKIDKPGATVYNSIWNPDSDPKNAKTLLTVGESLCRFYEVPDRADDVQELTHLDDPNVPANGVVTASAWHPQGHTAACAMEAALQLSDGGRQVPMQLILNHGREHGSTIWNADPKMLEPQGVVLCMRYSRDGTYLLVLRTNAQRGFVQVWKTPQPVDDAGSARDQPIAWRWFDRQALDACWTSDILFLICGEDGLSCAYQIDTINNGNEPPVPAPVSAVTNGQGLTERDAELIGFKAKWDKLRYDPYAGVAVLASTSSKVFVTRPMTARYAGDLPQNACLNGELHLPGNLTALAFQPRGPSTNSMVTSGDGAEEGLRESLLAATFEEGSCAIYRLTRPNASRAVSERVVSLAMWEGPALALAWSPQGTHLAFGGADVVHIYETAALSTPKNGARREPLVTWRPEAAALAAGKRAEEQEADGEQEVLVQPSLSWSSDGESLGFAVERQSKSKPTSTTSALMLPVIWTAVVAVLLAGTDWARRWALSGSAIESLLIVYGTSKGTRILSDVPLWTLLATVNLVYAICSTSWLLYGLFTAVCYPMIGITCLVQSGTVATIARKNLRKLLKQLHFTRDKIALFNLPALEIDTDVNGLMVIRGVTISLSKLTIIAHGVELGMKLIDDVELAMYADEVTIPLFRRVEVGDVYGSVKGGKTELFFGDVDDHGDTADDDFSMLGDTPLLRAATAGAEGFKGRPKNQLRKSQMGINRMKDSTAWSGFDFVKALSPDDEKAEKQYLAMLEEIRTTSMVHQSRQQVMQQMSSDSESEYDATPENDNDMRAAICAELRQLPSIAHPPPKSVRVTTLQNSSPPWFRRFTHRLPFLLRVLLAIISYFHLINIDSITVAGSGRFAAAMLQKEVFKHYATDSAELRRLERRVKDWLADANFCLELTGINGMTQVPLSTAWDIVGWLKFNDIMAYRTAPEKAEVAQVVRLGGADATATIPTFLLPHHEHVVPEAPTEAEFEDLAEEIDEADGMPKTAQMQEKAKKVRKDQAAISISVHASLPATFDQSLLDFVAALVKATKIIELEKEFDEVERAADAAGATPPMSPTSPTDDDASIKSDASVSTENGSSKSNLRFKELTKNIRQNLKDGTTGQQIKDLAKELQQSTNTGIKDLHQKTNSGLKDLHHNTRHGMKKAWVGGMVNDRWIAKMVGKVALKLQQAQGDLGYSGEIPIPLAPYRARGELPSKFLP
ncbi:hypothetical protein B0A55_04875 [Friedmanniomyces simplex]|uniref:Uncharacterized protein n=1 Tax=Friedmanniomyces simplex TaxID=329884 RepID=A0A4U0XKY9_9PEZI|nr:hypothetical protein B0A55_04875 [Friedmanniomyces simplex]